MRQKFQNQYGKPFLFTEMPIGIEDFDQNDCHPTLHHQEIKEIKQDGTWHSEIGLVTNIHTTESKNTTPNTTIGFAYVEVENRPENDKHYKIIRVKYIKEGKWKRTD